MIVFSCPECDTELEVPESKAGSKVACPDCGRRLVVPAPAKRPAEARTRDGGRSQPAKPPARETGQRPPPRTPPRRRDEEDEEEKPAREAPAKPKGKNNTLVIAGVGGGIILLLVVGLVIYALSNPEEPPASPGTPPTTGPVANVPPPAISSKPSGPQTNPPATNPVPTPDPKTTGQPPKTDPNTSAPTVHAASAKPQDIYKHVLKSAAWVVVKTSKGKGWGSGTLIDEEHLLVLTNFHVVQDAVNLVVFFPSYKPDGKLLAERADYMSQQIKNPSGILYGKVVAVERKKDLALIELQKKPEAVVEALPVARSGVSPGESVFSIGNRGDSEDMWLFTLGHVKQTAHDRWQVPNQGELLDFDTDVILSDSLTYHGDSGGPLVNERGELVGVTQGGSNAGGLSIFIDGSEVNKFVEDYCKKRGFQWKRGTRELVVHSPEDVPQLIQCLSSPDSAVRARAAQELARRGPEAQRAIRPLLDILIQEKDDVIRGYAKDALTKIPPGKDDVSRLREALKTRDRPEARAYAADMLARLGSDARAAVDDLLRVVKEDRDDTVRQNAARALGRTAREAKRQVVPALREVALQDKEHDVRVAAAEALTTNGVLTASDVPLMKELLKHTDVEVRTFGARALAELGRGAKPALTELMAAAKEDDRNLRRAAVTALAKLGPDAKPAVAVFADVLGDSDKETRLAAFEALGKLGPDAKEAVPALMVTLSDSDKDICILAAQTLAKTGPDPKGEVNERLVIAAKEGDKDARLEALTTLGVFGPEAKKAVRPLVEMFKNLDPENKADKPLYVKLVQTLAKVGVEAVKDLINVLDNTELDPKVREGAVVVLGEIGPPAKRAITALQNHAMLQKEYASIKKECKNALGKIMLR
jgi:HEAT repeat protein/S1-C subfamily serine protease